MKTDKPLIHKILGPRGVLVSYLCGSEESLKLVTSTKVSANLEGLKPVGDKAAAWVVKVLDIVDPVF